jgi:exopolysaccharide production protein ExoQ
MSPTLATLITLAFIFWLFRRDFREKPNVTGALWLPFFWVFISGSRFVSDWLAIFGLHLGGSSADDGSPVDALFFFLVIAAGIYVLCQRRVSLAEFIRNNQWVTIFLVYCLLAILWSDYPLIAFKRWIKLFGQPVMVLIVLTEPDPLEALIRLLKRCAYVWVPVSILFIRYYPALGRTFSPWTGGAANCGISAGKNGLGFICLVLGFFFFWHFLQVRQREKSPARRNEIILCLAFLASIFWLLHLAQSSTSLACLLIAIGMLWFLGLRFVNLRHIGLYLVAGVVICASAEALFGIHAMVISALNRDPTLTGRTDVWPVLLDTDTHPVSGYGFESYWVQERITKLRDLAGVTINEAHNGYLETYLQLGFVGLAITLGLIGATYAKASRALINDFSFGRFRLAYLVAILIYNWTEVPFRTHSVPFFLFFLCAIDYPKLELAGAEPAPDISGSEAKPEAVMSEAGLGRVNTAASTSGQAWSGATAKGKPRPNQWSKMNQSCHNSSLTADRIGTTVFRDHGRPACVVKCFSKIACARIARADGGEIWGAA